MPDTKSSQSASYTQAVEAVKAWRQNLWRDREGFKKIIKSFGADVARRALRDPESEA